MCLARGSVRNSMNGAFTSLGSLGYREWSRLLWCNSLLVLALLNGDISGFNHPDIINGVPCGTMLR